MTVRWITPAGSLGIITERLTQNIEITASSDQGPVEFSLLAGQLPRGLRLDSVVNYDANSGSTTVAIIGSPTEVRRFTESRFVIRAFDGTDIEDRTFGISVDGSDEPLWVTKEGFLNVGQGENYFVLDNALVDFQLFAEDTDEIAGDVLEYFLVAGELPPGLTLSRSGRISGFTDPVFAVDINTQGGYDTAAFDITYFDKPEARSNGFDSYFYDIVTFDYGEPSQVPRRLSRFYSFIVSVSDGANDVRRLFRIWVVTDEFLKADNSIVQVDTNLFRADNTSNRQPIWITESYLGSYRANNYLTVYLDVYDPPSLSGTIAYLMLPSNPDGSPSQLPPGMTLDSVTGEIAGKVPYQSRVKKTYTFTMQAIDFPVSLANVNYVLQGDWSNSIRYYVNQAVRYNGFIYVCVVENLNQLPNTQDSIYWQLGVSTAEKTFTIDIIGEIDSAIEWISESDLGAITANQPSTLSLEASSQLYGGRVVFQITQGVLPPGLQLLGTGDIVGKVKQFADDAGSGLTRFYERMDYNGLNSSAEDSSTMYRDFLGTWDGESTSFDKTFRFTVKARDTANFAELTRDFQLSVVADNTKTYANLFLKAFQSKQLRLAYADFITDNNIFRPDQIYRYGDPNFGIQTEVKVLLYAGMESIEAVSFVQAMSRNHYRKRIRFGEVKSAVAKDPLTQTEIYEAIYVEIVDEYEKNGVSISDTIELPDVINSKVLISYDAISVDSDIPFISDSDHQRVFPNSLKNMRKRIKAVGERDRTFLPLWMRSIQNNGFVETGYVGAMVICYCLPGLSTEIISRINARTSFASRGPWKSSITYIINDTVSYRGKIYTAVSQNTAQRPDSGTGAWVENFDFKSIDFEADRYIIDALDGELANKYLAFPQRGEKLP